MNLMKLMNPISISGINILDTLSVLILLSCFILTANKRPASYIGTFRLQSLLIAISAFAIGIEGIGRGEAFDIMIVGIIIVILKVFYIPGVLKKTLSGIEYKVEKDFFYNIPLLIFLCCLITAFLYFVLPFDAKLVNPVAVVFMGIFFMISRKKAIGQIIGFLVIENGLFITGMFASDGMPIIVDLGIFVDLLTAVLVMGIMVFKINEQFDTIDINKMRKLKG